MNDYLLSLVLGVVEGVTEFLPVSSTAHLRIAESLLHVSLSDGYWKMYSIVIQLGAILCLPVYFRERIAKFLSTFPSGERGDRNVLTHPLGLTMVAFVVTAIPSYLLTKVIGKNLESLYVMGCVPADWRHRHVGGGRLEGDLGESGPRHRRESDPHLAHGGYEPWAVHLDRPLPDSVGGLPRHIAIDGDNRRRTVGGDVAGVRSGIFFLSLDADHGRRHGLHAAEIAARQGRESDWCVHD